eukprot:c21662_g1_i1 orf=323-658(-)
MLPPTTTLEQNLDIKSRENRYSLPGSLSIANCSSKESGATSCNGNYNSHCRESILATVVKLNYSNHEATQIMKDEDFLFSSDGEEEPKLRSLWPLPIPDTSLGGARNGLSS